MTALSATPPPVMAFAGLSRTYPGPPPVSALHPADLSIKQGEYVSIVGPSGSGKSTFLNLAGLLDRPTSGAYHLDGIDTAALPERERTAIRGRKIGFVFQAFHLLPQRTAADNVALSMLYTGTPRRRRQQQALDMLDRVHLTDRAQALASQLSGGERQRVAIARALAAEPSLLLCDEPTGNLDSATAADILELIGALHAAGMTVLMVTHNNETAAQAQRIVTIRDGQLTEQVTA